MCMDWHQLTNEWIVVYEVVKSFRAKREASKNLASLYNLASIRDDSKLHEINYTITEHLWVDA